MPESNQIRSEIAGRIPLMAVIANEAVCRFLQFDKSTALDLSLLEIECLKWATEDNLGNGPDNFKK